MTTTTLKPGIYNLAPCHVDDDGGLLICMDPMASRRDLHDMSMFAKVPSPTDAVTTEGCPDSVVVASLSIDDDLAEEIDEESFNIQTAFGPLTVARHYSIIPAAAFTRNPEPGMQYTFNWLCFEITAEQEVSVSGSTIRIGQMEVDPTILGDVYVSTHTLDGETMGWGEIARLGRACDAVETRHVARCGTPLNEILRDMPSLKDDGVLYIADFTPEQLAEIEMLGTPEADAFAAAIRDQMAAGRNHICFSPAIS